MSENKLLITTVQNEIIEKIEWVDDYKVLNIIDSIIIEFLKIRFEAGCR